MAYPRMQALLRDAGLEIDDVRWYLSVQMCNHLLTFQEKQSELVQYIWSGKLADELYNIEERWLEGLESRLSDGQVEEAKVREYIGEMRSARRRRRQVFG